ncbi:MAG: transposase [Anaerolineales bacterium]|nr:transposase [Anaerolineales bacterium]
MNTNHHRRSIRLKHYDYAQNGAYFVTICTHERRCFFGTIRDGEMMVNAWGQIVIEEWEQTAILRPNVALDAFVVMPNHVHGIIVMVDDGRGMMHHAPTDHAPTQPPDHAPPKREFSKPIAQSLSTIIGTFKAAVTRRINRLPNASGHSIWQRNYYEHIIRNDDDLIRIREYIETNPSRWQQDSLFSN